MSNICPTYQSVWQKVSAQLFQIRKFRTTMWTLTLIEGKLYDWQKLNLIFSHKCRNQFNSTQRWVLHISQVARTTHDTKDIKKSRLTHLTQLMLPSISAVDKTWWHIISKVSGPISGRTLLAQEDRRDAASEGSLGSYWLYPSDHT